MSSIQFLDCTLRDGGYYNEWDFPPVLIQDYLKAMHAAGVNIVELGFRSLKNEGFKGANAYTTDDFVRSLAAPESLQLCVMINASEILANSQLSEQSLVRLFPEDSTTSPIGLVRVACHVHEFTAALKASVWLKNKGYLVAFNIMQIADRTSQEIEALAAAAAAYPLDVLYFADSMGSMNPDHTAHIIEIIRKSWQGPLGVHTHDNMGLALSNTLRAIEEGVTWLDSTVTGMGRGPGNAKTEYLATEIAQIRQQAANLIPLLTLIKSTFTPMQQKYGWGTNVYYYLAGKYGIHPSYVQEMLNDARYREEDIIAVFDHLRIQGGKSFSLNTLDAAHLFYQGPIRGSWSPVSLLKGREVLLLGTGPGVANHRAALESYVRKAKPIVIALNTQSGIDANLIDVRVACHPVRLLADCEAHTHMPQPLITPASMIPEDIRSALGAKKLLNYGLGVQSDRFEFADTYCIVPTSLVIAYALAVATSGQARRILLAGFDGYASDDRRNKEMDDLLSLYARSNNKVEFYACTPTRYRIPVLSIYGVGI